ALAIAAQETGGSFNPDAEAHTADEDSYGVFQLNTRGGEGQGLPDYVLHDPYLNAKIALQRVKAVLDENPGMSWGDIAALAQRPRDSDAYASSVTQWLDSIQTGQAVGGHDLHWASTLYTGSAAQRKSLAASQQIGSVPLPFSSDFYANVTQSFGEHGEQGTDFGMPEGQTVLSPVGGVVTTRDDGNYNWGRAVYVKMPNGWT